MKTDSNLNTPTLNHFKGNINALYTNQKQNLNPNVSVANPIATNNNPNIKQNTLNQNQLQSNISKPPISNIKTQTSTIQTPSTSLNIKS